MDVTYISDTLYIFILTAYNSSFVTYGRSAAVMARKAFSISSELWTFSVSLLIINAMYSCNDT